MTYRGNRAVIYRTEPGAEGLGTLPWVRIARKGTAIEGVAVRRGGGGDAPDLKHVSMRLPGAVAVAGAVDIGGVGGGGGETSEVGFCWLPGTKGRLRGISGRL